VVKRFEILYGEFASRDSNTTSIYALPTFETLASEAAIRYRGLDRDAVRPSDWEGSPAAEIRMSEINPDIDSGYSADYDRREFLATHVNAVEVLKWADEETPGVYEILWTRIAGRPDPPPPGFHAIGYEPTYFGSDHFSALCDCMCFPRWHGTDPGGTLFLPFFRQLNVNGLFDDAATAVEFLAFYLSFDWTETGNYETAEVWVPI
jgi:hypothetical protein